MQRACGVREHIKEVRVLVPEEEELVAGLQKGRYP